MRKAVATTILFLFVPCTMMPLFSACTMSLDSYRNTRVLSEPEAEKFIGSIRPAQGDAESHYGLGCYLQERKKHKPAIQEFTMALEIDPRHAKAYNAMGVSYDALGEHSRAVKSYAAALAIDQKLDYVLNNLGYCYLLQNMPDLAIENFKKALDLNTANALYRNNLGLAYAKSGQYSAAFAEFKLSGDDARAHYNLAQLYYRQGLYQEAESHFEQASVLKASDPEIERGLKAAGNLAGIVANSEKAPGRVEETAIHTEQKQTVTSSHAPSGSKVREDAEEKAARRIETEKLTLYDPEQALKFVNPEIVGMEKGLKSEIWIEVSNGNGVNRMARKVGTYLIGKGFAPKYLCNARHFGHEETRIYYAKGYLREANLLSEKLPGKQRLEEVAEIRKGNAEISILIGKDLIPYLNFFDRG